MSRRPSNSSRSLSIPAIIVLVILFGYRQWQTTHHASQNKHSGSSKTHSRSNSGSSQSETSGDSTGQVSNDGNLLLGNPTSAGKSPDNYLLERPQYSMSFNHSKGEPNWVSWHSDSRDLGKIKRGTFQPDPDLPPDWQIRPSDYTGGGYDRGHMCPSGDRTSTREANTATFYMSNMVPQTAELNQHVWADVENYLRDQIKAGNEIYEICGPAGNAGTIAGGKVVVPEICWKVAVILPEGTNDLKRINAGTRILSIAMPNVKDDRLKNGDWHNYIVTTSKVEEAIKLNLLSALPGNVQKALAAKTDSGN